jgi:hypothetical protein
LSKSASAAAVFDAGTWLLGVPPGRWVIPPCMINTDRFVLESTSEPVEHLTVCCADIVSPLPLTTCPPNSGGSREPGTMGTRLELSSRDRTILLSIRCAGADPYMVLLIPAESTGPDPR